MISLGVRVVIQYSITRCGSSGPVERPQLELIARDAKPAEPQMLHNACAVTCAQCDSVVLWLAAGRACWAAGKGVQVRLAAHSCLAGRGEGGPS